MVIRQRLLILAGAAVLMAFGWALFGPARHAEASPSPSPADGFLAPLPLPLTVLRGFDPPGQPWLAGNRGVDLAATTGEPVVAAADGVVLYAGLLAGRGVISISHGDIRTTYEPVDPVVARNASVRRGEVIAHVSGVADGCGPPGGCLHWGAIRGGGYLDPLALVAAPRVRLLPVWTDGLPTSAPQAAATEAATATPPSGASPAGSAGLDAAAGSAGSAAAPTPTSTTTRRPAFGAAPTAAVAGAAISGVGLAVGMAAHRRARSPRPRPRSPSRPVSPSRPDSPSTRKLPAP